MRWTRERSGAAVVGLAGVFVAGGMGGVQRGADALDLLEAGATLVAVGTESFRDPLSATRIGRELTEMRGGRRLEAPSTVR